MDKRLLLNENLDTPEVFQFGDFDLGVFISKNPERRDSLNQDSLGVLYEKDRLVVIVADGAGGHPKGDFASKMAVEVIFEELTRKKSEKSFRELILDGIQNLNEVLLLDGNGARTTLTVTMIEDGNCRVFQVGDSGMLICGKKGKIKYKTLFHSPVGYALESGMIEESEALSHPDLNIVSNLMGDLDMKVEIGPAVSLAAQDTILVASDGLFDNFLTSEIVEAVRIGDVAEACNSLANRFSEPNIQNLKKLDDLSFVICRQRG